MKKVLKILIYLGAIIWLIICIKAVINHVNTYSFGDSVVMICMGIFPLCLIGVKKLVENLNKKANIKKRMERDRQINEKINNLQFGLPVINIPNLFLGDAKLHFYEPAVRINTENKMVGLVNETTETTKTFDRFSLIPGYQQFDSKSTGSSEAVYKDITKHYNGQLAITSKSILFINQQNGFELKICDLSFVQEYADAISIQSGNNVYTLLISEPSYCIAILNKIKNNYA